jgi:uncharacterized protein
VTLNARVGIAFNKTRGISLAQQVKLANNHWTRFRGLIGSDAADFISGKALWIVPCRGVHMIGMRFPIDVLYLDKNQTVVHMERVLKPWRIGPVRLDTASVLELPVDAIQNTGTLCGDEIRIEFETETASPL